MANRVIADGRPVSGPIRVLVPGSAAGRVVHLEEPLSFWGGFDPASGRVIDRHHPQLGESLTGRIVVMGAGRGSSSASSVIAESIRLGTGPAAIVMTEVDEIVTLGAIVSDELYGAAVPVVLVTAETFRALAKSREVEITGVIVDKE